MNTHLQQQNDTNNTTCSRRNDGDIDQLIARGRKLHDRDVGLRCTRFIGGIGNLFAASAASQKQNEPEFSGEKATAV